MNVTPKLEEVLAYSGDASHMTISTELLIDTETPISLYQKLAPHGSGAFLLESAEGGETFGRYSFIGFEPAKMFSFSRGHGVIRKTGEEDEVSVELDDPLEILQELLAEYRIVSQPNLPRFIGGAVGYLGYDCVRYFENVPIPQGPEGTELPIPEGWFVIAERLVVIDHLKHRVILVDLVPLAGERASSYAEGLVRLELVAQSLAHPLPIEEPFATGDEPDLPPLSTIDSMASTDYVAAVEEAKKAIEAGEIFQVVFSHRYTIDVHLPSFDLYRALRALNPSPYMFHIAMTDGWAIVGASPEVLVRVDGDEILLRPIAGTRPRGVTRAEDESFEKELLADEKELAEHKMLLDLGRNDVGRVAEVGSVEVARPLHIERFSHVMHIVSDVRGKLAKDKTAFDVMRACFPAGTVSGAPKIRAMEIISKLETVARGVYSGAVGYFDFTGNMDTCIAIRTMVCGPEAIYLQAGGGLVHDSIPEKELEESQNKAKSGFAAIALARARVRSRLPIEEQPTNPVAVADRSSGVVFGEDKTQEMEIPRTLLDRLDGEEKTPTGDERGNSEE